MESTSVNFITSAPELPCSQSSSNRRSRRKPSRETALRVRRSAKRSGKSVSGSTATSPRRPCGRRTRPTVTKSWALEELVFFNDVEVVFAVAAQAGGVEDGAQRARGAPLLADDLAQVAGGDAQLQHGAAIFVNRGY